MNVLAAAIVAAIAFSGMLALVLLGRQAASVASHRNSVPQEFASEVSLADHQRAAAYTLARARLAMAQVGFDTILALLWLMLLLNPLYSLVALFAAPGIVRSVAFVIAFAAAERLLHLPFALYRTFWLEERFGFNRESKAMFLLDTLKGALLSLVIGVPLFLSLFMLLALLPGLWWLIAWAGFMGVTIAMSIIFPSVIAPWFNKFTPLPDGPLRARVEALLAKCGFEPKGLYVMDASRRSTHGNAYFTGFGRAKRIVFFDTLLQTHTADEILSILAHELGHYKLGHIVQRIALLAGFSLVGLGALAWAFATGEPARAFGLPQDPGAILIAAAIAAAPLMHLLSPLMSWFSRRAEFQADNFAKAFSGAPPMISALIKLTRDNLSTLTPDFLYAWFYYSHPPVQERIAQLRAA
jgi:STE24 endopeptidase